MAHSNWRAEDLASRVFPKGSEIAGDFALLWADVLQRMIRFPDLDAVDAARDRLFDIVDIRCSTR